MGMPQFRGKEGSSSLATENSTARASTWTQRHHRLEPFPPTRPPGTCPTPSRTWPELEEREGSLRGPVDHLREGTRSTALWEAGEERL